MKMKISVYLFIILTFLSIPNKGFSQKSLDYYFDDGGLSKANNLWM